MATAPWELPAQAVASQFLYRGQLTSPEGELKVRLALRLAAPDRFALAVTDPLGRALWTVTVAGKGALFVDQRRSVFCRLAPGDPLPDESLGGATILAIPAVLLGRLPFPPPSAEAPPSAAVAGDIGYPLVAGRRLTARLTATGGVERWTLWQGEEPVTWWAPSAGNGGLLSVRRRPGGTDGAPAGPRAGPATVQLRWQQVVREPLAEPGSIAALPEPPAGFAESLCDGSDDPH